MTLIRNHGILKPFVTKLGFDPENSRLLSITKL